MKDFRLSWIESDSECCVVIPEIPIPTIFDYDRSLNSMSWNHAKLVAIVSQKDFTPNETKSLSSRNLRQKNNPPNENSSRADYRQDYRSNFEGSKMKTIEAIRRCLDIPRVNLVH